MSTGLVYVVDDDPAVRDALASLVRSIGLEVRTFPGAGEFLAHERPDVPSCLVLDVRLPGLSGLDLQKVLGGPRSPLPIIFITGHGDIPMTVRAMKQGAVEFLAKPFDDHDLVAAIEAALQAEHADRHARTEMEALRSRFSLLTVREREVAERVVRGLLNKQIAAELAISEGTVKVHRRSIMRKLDVHSVPDLVRVSGRVGGAGTPGETP